ncbi:hypothetical protein [Clostridium butyricum]|uniref:hypothetical protein n=1 Tax=Clostridium butyricum TaxID=1492 RepID=UPI00374EF722
MMKIMKKGSDFFSSIRYNSNIIIYGAGILGRAIYDAQICKINYFCDKNAKIIKRIGNVEVLDIEGLKNIEGDFKILITSVGKQGEEDKIIKFIEKELISQKLDGNIEIYNIVDNTQILIDGIIKGSNDIVIDIRKYLDSIPLYLLECYSIKEKNYIRSLFPQLEVTTKSINTLVMVDYKSKYFNIKNGQRITLNQKDDTENTIHMYGDSRVLSVGVEDKFTISSKLQRILNTNNLKYNVENNGITKVRGFTLIHMWYQLKNTSLKNGDIVIFSTHFYMNSKLNSEIELFVYELRKIKKYCEKFGVEFYYINLPFILEKEVLSQLDNNILKLFRLYMEKYDRSDLKRAKNYLTNLLNREKINYFDFLYCINDNTNQLYYDWCHFTEYGNELIAKWIFEILNYNENENSIELEKKFKELEKKYKDQIFNLYNKNYLEEYFMEIRDKIPKGLQNIGIIVMNCNPFTNGHKYLVDNAYKEVEFLIICVLEEDKSKYSFEERFSLVLKNTKEYEDILVIKSSKFIISTLTFPEYFSKDSITYDIDSTRDILLFASKIAPILNVKKRFVGEEPFCKVTKKYNEQMKEILPEYGIELIEIPRKKYANKAISASEVRKLVENQEWKKIRKIVPCETYLFLKEKHNN